MVGLDNNDVELLKFNPEESERLRQAFVAAEMEKHRLAQAEYKNAQRPEVITRLSAQARQANEKAGYTLVQNAWLAPEPVMSAAIDAARRKTQQQQLERANQERLGKIAVIESQAQSLISKNTLAPAIERLDPEEVIRARQAEAKREAEAEAKRIADAEAQRLAADNNRVLMVDLTGIGKAAPGRAMLFSLLTSAIGDRPLGIVAGQLAAVARWAAETNQGKPVGLVAVGPRMSFTALVAASQETKAVGSLQLTGALASLKEVIETNKGVNDLPELFCFGLLKEFDVKHIAALVAPRRIVLREPSDGARQELAGLLQ